MKHLKPFGSLLLKPFGSLLLISALLIDYGCKPSVPEVAQETTDTRILVKQAFDSIDLNAVTSNFNMARSELIKAEIKVEKDPGKQLNLGITYAIELLKAGKTVEAINYFNTMAQYIIDNNIVTEPKTRRDLYSIMAITYMRHGEIENCVKNHNHQSCYLPIAGDGVHQLTFGSENAISLYETLLKEFPEDLESKYLLNIAYMTLGNYPDSVPSAWRIDPSWFQNKKKIQPFKDIAPDIGLNRQNLAGGTVIDDFTNDGWLDIIITSWSPVEELIFYVNNGDGSFTDLTKAYKLDGHVGSLNLNQTDFNNDGWLDIFLMRGAWYGTEGDIPSTLLMNTGKGYFEDVTIKSGLTHKAASQNAAWADYNLDGWLDVVIGNESLPGYQRGIDFYINQKDGTFKNASTEYNLTLNQFFKGCVATDLNNDRYPDLVFSGLTDGNFLFLNKIAEGKGFEVTSSAQQLRDDHKSFPCFNFDYDNDGDEDLFVSGFNNEGTPSKFWMLSQERKADPAYLPRFYQNNGNYQFTNVAQDIGLTEVVFAMGCNFGDINVDGYLDFYLGTGNPLYQSLVPNKMYLNMGGKRFEDVSYSGGFANIQKGHGVGFGDLDHDGDEDIYIVMGGAYDGDGFYNSLFENPNELKNNWLVLNLKGTACNAPAIGARVMISITEGGRERKIYRTVTSGSSFGGNSLALEVGMGKASQINNVTVQWPCLNCPDQTFTDLQLNHAYVLTQGDARASMVEYKPVIFKAAVGGHEHMHH